ncbi:hypothetical protein CFV354_0729 [Campylobacter fetus subsp. venerealis NCTC 10354]|nr:hypothetical protein CFV354_0729 [Campylobacter fetus subsp. venerealis NCTC 10354]
MSLANECYIVKNFIESPVSTQTLSLANMDGNEIANVAPRFQHKHCH